jgi:hypothetical protein
MAFKDYHIHVFHSTEEGIHRRYPGLLLLLGLRQTAEDAVREVTIAKKAWLASAKASGKRIPKPRYRPAIYQLQS